jgi:diaminopimelate epimerase
MFPERANIVFVKLRDRNNIEIRIWERGAGETSASGTCASGAAVLCAAREFTERDVLVHSPGGVTEVVWRDDGEILLTGNAELSYCGEWPN